MIRSPCEAAVAAGCVPLPTSPLLLLDRGTAAGRSCAGRAAAAPLGAAPLLLRARAVPAALRAADPGTARTRRSRAPRARGSCSRNIEAG